MRNDNWWLRLSIGVALLVVILPVASRAGTFNTTVLGWQGPWSVSSNPGFVYGDAGAWGPDVLHGAPGNAFTVTYSSGWVDPGPPNDVWVDANGYSGYAANNTLCPSWWGCYPSEYMSPYPIYISELVGAFANNGVIVGTPFALGDSWSGVMPAGANQLLLGVNDNWFWDNSGAWTLQVQQTTPEPCTLMLLGSFLGLGGLLRRRKQGC